MDSSKKTAALTPWFAASGTATAGYRGTATAGDRGTICIRYYDRKNDRYRTLVGYVGEDGIKANTAYRLDDEDKFAEVAA